MQDKLLLQEQLASSLLTTRAELSRRKDEGLVAMEEAAAMRAEAARLESEAALQADRLRHEAEVQRETLEAETEGRLRFEVRRPR